MILQGQSVGDNNMQVTSSQVKLGSSSGQTLYSGTLNNINDTNQLQMSGQLAGSIPNVQQMTIQIALQIDNNQHISGTSFRQFGINPALDPVRAAVAEKIGRGEQPVQEEIDYRTPSTQGTLTCAGRSRAAKIEGENNMTETSDVWTGKASSYDRARPTPPPALLDLLTQLIHMPHPALVVDLGSGTGLSTAIWGERAEQVIGIEPNADMRTQAVRKIEDHPYAAHIEYREGLAHQTGLPDGCADIVTAAQSFHWMEPTSTLAEIARILRPGGLFAAYDYDWPPLFHWELDLLAQEVVKRLMELVRERGMAQNLKMWSKEQHLNLMRESGHFRFTREVLLHHIEYGDAARFLESMRSNALSLQFQFTEQESGVDRLSSAAFQALGFEAVPWYVSYRVRIGIK